MGWIRDLLRKGGKGGAHRTGGDAPPTPPTSGGRASKITSSDKLTSSHAFKRRDKT